MEEISRKINVSLTYPRSNEYEYVSKIMVLDMDKEAQDDIASGNGFIISSPKNSNKKDMKDPDGIYSSRYGQILSAYRVICKFSSVNCR